MSQALANEKSAGPTSAATLNSGKDTGVPQSVPQKKKPLFTSGEGDIRLQAAEALVFIQEMTPDLGSAELFYFERAIEILNRLVDDDHADLAAFLGFC